MIFVGAYWSARRATRAEVAERLASVLRTLSSEAEALARWFPKGRAAAAPLDFTAEALAPLMRVNGAGDDDAAELGFSVTLTNAATITLTATAGAFHPQLQNSVVLSFLDDAPPPPATWQRLLEHLIAALDPELATATSTDLLSRVGAKPWELGFLSYARGGTIAAH